MTFSIVACDKRNGLIGVAVQSHYFSVGSVVSWARAGVGAVATQSMVDASYGPKGLELMASGLSAADALNKLVKKDERSMIHQVAMIDSDGVVAVHTGKKCIPCAGHATGNEFSVQANLVVSSKVWNEMKVSYEKGQDLCLPERLLSVLYAAQKVGGDLRGQQSAALLVVKSYHHSQDRTGKVIDLRVDDHQNPLDELSRLLRISRAMELGARSNRLLIDGKEEESLSLYNSALKSYPSSHELVYKRALTLIKTGKINEGKHMLSEFHSKFPNYKELTRRIFQDNKLKISTQWLAASDEV